MKLKRILATAIVVVMSFGAFSLNVANAAGAYAISCNNSAYGMQLGNTYTSIQKGLMTNQGTALEGAYVGNDCIYAGAANTNGSAVVAADVARLAINSIIGAVSNRIDMAYATNNSGTNATGMSYTTLSDGVAMSANQVWGGLSFWADVGNSNFKNIQDNSDTSGRTDNMQYDGDSTTYSVGVDKTFGKALVGVLISNVDVSLDTTFNSGRYTQDIDTYGIYVSYKTSVIQIDLGTGLGSSDITTTRKDLGNGQTINGETTADIEYYNARIVANFVRGRFSLVPSVAYARLEMEMAGFTDDYGTEGSTISGGEDTLFNQTNTADNLIDDDIISKKTYSSAAMSLGLKLQANLGKVVPYLDMSYASESTTKAKYIEEVEGDGIADGGVSKYTTSFKIGGGINFGLSNNVTGGVRVGTITGRKDWEENYIAGNITLGF